MLVSCRDPVQPAAQAHQCPGGAVDVPGAVQQPAPAAQRPGVGQVADRLLDECAQPCLQAVVGPLGVAEGVFGLRSPTGACQCSLDLAMPRKPRSSRLATSTRSSASSRPARVSSSCSWQLPGQPPSSHSRSPWTVATATPWAVWCAAWRHRAPSGWPSRGVAAPACRARPPAPPPRPRPSRQATGQARPGCDEAAVGLAEPQRGQLAQQQVHAVAHFGLGDADRAAGAAVRQPVQQHRPDGVQADLQRQRRGAAGARWARRGQVRQAAGQPGEHGGGQ
jgi:hypothetical protein